MHLALNEETKARLEQMLGNLVATATGETRTRLQTLLLAVQRGQAEGAAGAMLCQMMRAVGVPDGRVVSLAAGETESSKHAAVVATCNVAVQKLMIGKIEVEVAMPVIVTALGAEAALKNLNATLTGAELTIMPYTGRAVRLHKASARVEREFNRNVVQYLHGTIYDLTEQGALEQAFINEAEHSSRRNRALMSAAAVRMAKYAARGAKTSGQQLAVQQALLDLNTMFRNSASFGRVRVLGRLSSSAGAIEICVAASAGQGTELGLRSVYELMYQGRFTVAEQAERRELEQKNRNFSFAGAA